MNAKEKGFSFKKAVEEAEKEFGKGNSPADLDVVISRRDEYEWQVCDDLLQVLNDKDKSDLVKIMLWHEAEFPNEQSDYLILSFKISFLDKLISLNLIKGYELRSDIIGDYLDGYDFVFANIKLTGSVSFLKRYLKKSKAKVDNDKKVIYRIAYNKNSREVILNGKYILSHTDFESENDKFFEYVFRNPNIFIQNSEFRKKKVFLKKRVHNIVNDLGFKGELAKMFFKKNKTGCLFKNPINEADLDELNINNLKLQRQIVALDKLESKK